MRMKLLTTALAASGLLGLVSCGSINNGTSHYVPANNGKGGVQVFR